jgi:predicted dehydrogenase
MQRAAAAGVAPFFAPRRSWSQDAAPGKKLVMGMIGMGKQMGGLMSKFLQYPEVQIVAVCDVDTTRRMAAKDKVDKAYGNPDCRAVNDFREITEDKGIDAVCIATPDHWHAIVALSAVTHGKDVYCEKPLTHNIHEALTLVETTRKNERILQTGSMQRSSAEFRIACELVRNGVIGEIKTIDTSFGDPAKPNANPEESMEPGLDWNRWCGPAPKVPYSSVLSPRGIHNHFPQWRMTREFGGGMITDWGAHHIDIAQWGMGMDENGPVEVKAPENWDDPHARGAQLIYASGIVVTHVSGKGVEFKGTKGTVSVNRGKFEVVLDDGKTYKFWDKEKDKSSLQREYTLAERDLLADAKVKLYNSKDQIQDFLACVKSRQKPVCDVGIGASSAICCHLMNFAYWYGASFKWDPIKHQFINGGDTKGLTREYRGVWRV